MELLSPAGNFKKAKYAFHYGADAVYIGSGFSLRKGADNDENDVENTIKLAKQLNKKVYIASNIFFKNKHIDRFKDYLEKLAELKPDALIVSDFAMVNYIAKKYSDIEVHVSTQANVTNYETAKFLKELGACRIIPARELHIDEISEIINKANIDIEVFCHGALCMAYSGRCMMSAYVTANQPIAKKEINRRLRDANQGDCAHPCRYEYHVIENMRPNEVIEIHEDEEGMKIFNSRDLCLIKKIEELKKAGVCSLKIEGRMKSVYYVAVTTMAYRECLENGYSDKCFTEVDSVSHRPFTEGFIFHDKEVHNPVVENYYVRKTDFLGTIEEKIDDSSYRVDVLNKIDTEDELEIVKPNMEIIKLKSDDYILTDEDGTKLDFAGRHTKLIFKTNVHLSEMDIIRKRK